MALRDFTVVVSVIRRVVDSATYDQECVHYRAEWLQRRRAPPELFAARRNLAGAGLHRRAVALALAGVKGPESF
jgi:hypothetical protein